MKIISTLLLFVALTLMLYVNIGQLGGVYIDIREAKKEASEARNNKDFTVLTVSEADLSSGRASFTGRSEIIFKGSLYDIASKTEQGGKLILKVLHDKKEEGLLSDLKEIMDTWVGSTPKNSKQPSLKQIVLLKDFVPACKFAYRYNADLTKLLSFSFSCPATAPLIAVLKSPPKFV